MVGTHPFANQDIKLEMQTPSEEYIELKKDNHMQTQESQNESGPRSSKEGKGALEAPE